MKNNLDVKCLFLIALVAFLTISIWFRHGYQLGTAEGGLPFNNLQRHAEVFRYTWADTNLGNSTGYLVAAYPTYWFLSFFEKIGIPAFLIEAAVFWIVLTAAGFGMYGIGRKIINLSSPFALIAVFFYWVSPFVQVNIWSRFLYNHIFFFALLPLGTYFFLAGIIKRSYTYLILTLLTLMIFSYSLTALALTILILAIFLGAILYSFLINRNRDVRFFYLKYLSLFLAGFVLINFWWLSQFFAFGISSSFNQSISAFFTTEGNVSGLTQISSKLGSFIDLTRFIHYSFFYENASVWAGSFITKKALLLNSAILGLIFFGIYLSRRNKYLLFFSFLFIFSLFFAKGNNPPFGEIYTYFFVKSSLLQTFRNPIEKISLVTVLAGGLLFAYALEYIQSRFVNSKLKGYLPLAAALFLIFFWGWSFFSGLVFTSYKNSLGETFNYETEVPEYYAEANKYIQEKSEINRILVVPLLGEGITYKWPIPYTGIDLYSTLFDKQNIALNTTIPFYYDIIGNVVNYQDSMKLLEFIPFLAIDGIILREDVDSESRSFPQSDDSKKFLKQLETQGYLKKDRSFGPLTLYIVNPSLKWGKFYMTNHLISTNEKDISQVTGEENSGKRVYIDPLIPLNSQIKPQSIIVSPSKINQYYWLEKYEKQSLADLYSQLLYVKHSPDDLLYPFVRSKEFLTSFLYTDYPKWVLFRTDLLGKRAVEICQYLPVDTNNSSQDLLMSYKNEYLDLISHVKTIVDEKRDLKDNIFNSLAAQSVLLSRCGQIPFAFYQQSFIDIGLIPAATGASLDYTSRVEMKYQIPQTGLYHKKDNISADNLETELLERGEKTVLYSQNNAYSETLIIDEKNIDVDLEWILDQPLIFDDNNSEYLIEIDYQTYSGDFLGIFVKQDFDPPKSPLLFQGIPLSDNQSTYTFTITPSKGSKKAQVGLTGNKNIFCANKCTTSTNQLKAKVTRFQIMKKTLKKPYFTLKNQIIPIESEVKWTKVSPVEYQVNINKKSSDPEILVFSELYSDGWSIQDKNNQHVLVNSYANGWIIDQVGEYDLKVYYQPEKKLIWSYWISILSISGVFVSLFLVWKLKWKEK